MTMSRRELLKNGLAMSGVAAVHATHPDTYAATPSRPTPPQLTPFDIDEIDNLDALAVGAEHNELRKYRALLMEEMAVDDNVMRPGGISVPFATVPVSCHCRTTEAQRKMPEPQIPELHGAMTAGGWYYKHQIQGAILALMTLPKKYEIVGKIDLKMVTADRRGYRNIIDVPCNRIVTPSYIVDVEEPWFNMRTTAGMIIDVAEGLNQELNKTLASAIRRAEDVPRGFRTRHEGQLLAPQVSLIREGFMLQCMSWITFAAYAQAGVESNAAVEPWKKVLDGDHHTKHLT